MLQGSFSPAGDKSVSHRIALFSLLATGTAQVSNYSPGADCQSSLAAIQTLGCLVRREENPKQPNAQFLYIRGAQGKLTHQANIDCGNSGTTIRLLMGILAGIEGVYTLDGDQYLRKRPMQRIATPLQQMGAKVVLHEGNCPLTVHGGALQGIEYVLPVASAQLKSAVLLAALRAQSPTTVIEPVKSRDHTELMLKSFGADISQHGERIHIRPSTISLPGDFYVPADPSSAAFFLCAAALIPGSRVTARGILLNPTRTGFLRVLERMGVHVEIEERSRVPEPWGDITVSYMPNLQATDIHASEVPSLVDEIPVLALVAARAAGTSIFYQVNELRIKETDRLVAIRDELSRLGAQIKIIEKDGDSALQIRGTEQLQAPAGTTFESYGDHRMAMTLRLALLKADADAKQDSAASGSLHQNCTIVEEECVAVSYPSFHNDLRTLLR